MENQVLGVYLHDILESRLIQRSVWERLLLRFQQGGTGLLRCSLCDIWILASLAMLVRNYIPN